MMLHSFTKLSCILLALLQICGCIVSAGPIKRAEPAFAPKSPAAGSPQPARGPSLAARSGGKTGVQKPKAPVLGKPLKKNGHMDVNPPSSSSSATSESGDEGGGGDPGRFRPGDIVGARIKHYEPSKPFLNAIHPAVVVAGPLPRNWYRISVITNNPHPELKGYDPREKISKYLDPSVKGLGGTISLGIPRLVEGRVINIWKRKGYGETPPLRADKLAMLKQDINAHTRGSWFQPLTRRALEIDEVD